MLLLVSFNKNKLALVLGCLNTYILGCLNTYILGCLNTYTFNVDTFFLLKINADP